MSEMHPFHSIIHDLQPFTLVDYPGHVACTVFTAGCNLRCPYCHNADLIAPTIQPTIDMDSFLQFLKKRKGLLSGICITGGEPTLHDLSPILSLIKKEGYEVKLDTNGTRPGTWINWVEEGLIDFVAMDIKVPLENYDKMGASMTDIKGIRQSVQFLLAHPIAYEFRTTIHPNWLVEGDIVKIGAWLKGAKRLVLQPFVPSDKVLNPEFCEGMGYEKEALQGFQEILSRTIDVVHVRGV